MNRVVVLLARAPSAKGKTRLTGHLSEALARSLRERLFLDTLAAARRAGYPVMVCYTPDDAREEMHRLAGDAALIVQRGADLGARMRNAMADALASGAGAVVLIGSDLPTLPSQHLAHAFDLLDRAGSAHAPRCDVVLGPSEDGGFYLIGARDDLPDIFAGVEWGGSDVLARVAAAAQHADVTVGLASAWWDADVPEDLRRCHGYEEFIADNP
jgi:rSAM/selenodomain-associated transferase 1